MRCPYCLNDESKVIDKRDVEGIAKRRRECLKCEKRFNTIESVEHIELFVLKKDGKRQIFDREKLRRGIVRACEKRPVNGEQIDRMIGKIEEKIMKTGKEIESREVGEMVSRELKKLDKVAYIRFASVYKEFADISDFKKEIRELISK